MLLAVCLVGCLSTIFTASSTSMMNAKLRVIPAPVQHHCRKPLALLRACQAEGKESCSELDLHANKCKNVIRRAFQHINMGGCPYEIKAVTLCEAEWCTGDNSACRKECALVRESLTNCVNRHVSAFFQKNNLHTDGTVTPR